MPTVITCGVFAIYGDEVVLFCMQFGPGGYVPIQGITAVAQLINNGHNDQGQGLTIELCKSDFILVNRIFLHSLKKKS
jgi:hypothetical protein